MHEQSKDGNIAGYMVAVIGGTKLFGSHPNLILKCPFVGKGIFVYEV